MFQKYIDIPIFVGANVAIDLEPLYVLIIRPDYPLHGYLHTLLFGSAVGLLFGIVAHQFKTPLTELMAVLRLPYSTTIGKATLSGVLGAWLHVLTDAPMYTDIKPFFPSMANPLYGLYSMPAAYILCSALFVPAVVLYYVAIRRSDI
jgi:membrane-bound metal-dependent hydrolase YbcI (DUF457 family)